MSTPPGSGETVRAHARGSVLALTVVPRSSKNQLQMQADGTLRARIAAPPVDGAANAALLKMLAEALGVPKSRLSLVMGETGRRKQVLVVDLPPDELRERLITRLR